MIRIAIHFDVTGKRGANQILDGTSGLTMEASETFN
jgi:hypothetical protein